MFIIKQLRRKKSASQTDLANIIGVSLRTIQLYEKKGANIPIKNLTKIAEYFETSIGQLYAKEVNEDNMFYDTQNIESKKGHSIRKLAPGKYLLSAPLITTREQAVYLQNVEDQKLINSLVQVGFVVDQVSVSGYMAFEIADNAMDNGSVQAMPQRTIVLGKQIHKRELARKLNDKQNIYWIIVYKDTIMCKEIVAYDRKKGTLICHSLKESPEYPDFEINFEEIKQLFMIIKRQMD